MYNFAHQEQVITDGMESDAAEFVGRQLDFLNKELHRLQASLPFDIG